MSESGRPPFDKSESHRSALGLMRSIKRWFAPMPGDSDAVRDVLEGLIEERIEENPEGDAGIDPNERLLLSNVLKLRDLTARDIMVPRADIVALDAGTPLQEALTQLMHEGHSRVPVYRGTLDEVIGFVHIKDLAVAALPRTAPVPPARPASMLTDVTRRVLFVSPAVRVLDLLLEMRLKRTHMALVVDEFGGIDGLLTIEDVVEQIVGEIEDEHDNDETPQLHEAADGTVFADARLTLAEFEAFLQRKGLAPVFSETERDETDTLGGLVTGIAGRVPARGALVKHSSGIEFEVIDSDPRRVRQLRIRELPAPYTPE